MVSVSPTFYFAPKMVCSKTKTEAYMVIFLPFPTMRGEIMAEGMEKAFVVYCSPAGSTQHVAQVIEQALDALNASIRAVDLGKEKKWEPIFQDIVESGNRACLFIGSPVYAGHPVPPIMRFIGRMPETPDLFAVPFVTWGQVISGMALYDMGDKLRTKNVKVIGAAKVLAVHSMMWDNPRPLGQGHPNADDDRMIVELVKKIGVKMADPETPEIRLSDLRYYPDAVCKEIDQRTLEVVKPHMPKRTLDAERCIECGTCAEQCPADAIVYSPFPEFTDDCIYCYGCVQNCPEGALTTDKAFLDGYLRERSADIDEKPYSKIFF
jgi:ferredoxin/flavodoxin